LRQVGRDTGRVKDALKEKMRDYEKEEVLTSSIGEREKGDRWIDRQTDRQTERDREKERERERGERERREREEEREEERERVTDCWLDRERKI
jgi:hypothetical protein